MGVSTFPAAVIPAGLLMPSARSDAPPGWLLCDGAAVSRTTYVDLYAAISTTYGTGDGSTTFNLPNLKGKTVVMKDAGQTEFAALAQTGGSKSSTASHTHTLSHTHTMANHTHALATHVHGLENHIHTVSNHGHQLENHTHSGGTGYHAHNVTGVVGTSSTSHDHHGAGGQVGAVPGGANFFTSNGTTDSQGFGNPAQGVLEAPNTGNPFNWGGAVGASSIGAAQGPSNNTSDGANVTTTSDSSVTAASGNLQPYMALNYLIKT